MKRVYIAETATTKHCVVAESWIEAIKTAQRITDDKKTFDLRGIHCLGAVAD